MSTALLDRRGEVRSDDYLAGRHRALTPFLAHVVGASGLELGRSLPLGPHGDPVRTIRLELVPPPDPAGGKHEEDEDLEVEGFIAQVDKVLDIPPENADDDTSANEIYQRDPYYDGRLVGHTALGGLEFPGNTLG